MQPSRLPPPGIVKKLDIAVNEPNLLSNNQSIIQERTRDLDLAPGSAMEGVSIVTLGDSMDESESAPNL